MVQRVNFLQRGKYALTYQNMAIVLGLWLVLCVGVHGIFILEGVWARTKTIAAKEILKALTMEFEKQAQLAQATKTVERTGTAIQSLASVFQVVPRWSKAMDELAAAMPGQVWLTLMKTSGDTVTGAVRHIEVEGRGRSAEAITQFVQRLDDQPIFQNVVLSRSTKDADQGDLIFTVAADVVFSGA